MGGGMKKLNNILIFDILTGKILVSILKSLDIRFKNQIIKYYILSKKTNHKYILVYMGDIIETY